jgi:hypothetical protein
VSFTSCGVGNPVIVPVNAIDAPRIKLTVLVAFTEFVIVIVEHGFDACGEQAEDIIVAVIPRKTVQFWGETL